MNEAISSASYNRSTAKFVDQKDSKDVASSFLDYMTWPEIARAYLESTGEHQDVLKIVKDSKFPRVTIEEKISVMKTLSDIYLSSNKVRDKLMMSGEIRHEEICRSCHKTGDLLCCEMCPAVYHLVCCDPPLDECYISVLKSVLREEDASGTQFGPPDQKDSKDAALSFLDYMTWPEIARAYLESMGEHQDVLKIVKDSKFPRVTIEEKISATLSPQRIDKSSS